VSNSNGSSILGIKSDDVPYDVGDRAQGWCLVYENHIGGFVGQRVVYTTDPNFSAVKLRNAFVYEKKIVVHAGAIVTGPGQVQVMKANGEEERNVWDIDGYNPSSPDAVVTITSPRLVVVLADADAETRTIMNGAITVIEGARKAKLSAKTGLDLSGRIDPSMLAAMRKPQ
jgi:hypothetical protein